MSQFEWKGDGSKLGAFSAPLKDADATVEGKETVPITTKKYYIRTYSSDDVETTRLLHTIHPYGEP